MCSNLSSLKAAKAQPGGTSAAQAQRSSSCQHHFRSTVYAPRTQPQSPSSQHSSWRRGYWCRGCATSRQPTPSLVVDQLQAASVHACCLHNHHGHVPQPLRLMPAGMAFTREPLAAVQRDVQGGGECKSWWTSAGGTVDFRLAVWRAVCHRVFEAQRLSSCRPPLPSTSHPAAGAATTKHRRGAHHHHGRLLLTPCGATTTSWATGNARLCVCPGAARHAPAFVHYRHRGRDESALPPMMSFACSLLVALTLERAVPLKARWPLGGDKRASLLSRRRY